MKPLSRQENAEGQAMSFEGDPQIITDQLNVQETVGERYTQLQVLGQRKGTGHFLEERPLDFPFAV